MVRSLLNFLDALLRSLNGKRQIRMVMEYFGLLKINLWCYYENTTRCLVFK